jgi:hypothetical protein
MTNICHCPASLALITTALCAQQAVVTSEDTGRKVSVGSYSLFLDCTGSTPGLQSYCSPVLGARQRSGARCKAKSPDLRECVVTIAWVLAKVIALFPQRKRHGRSPRTFTRSCLTQGLRRHTSSSATRSAASMRGSLRTFIPRWFRGWSS